MALTLTHFDNYMIEKMMYQKLPEVTGRGLKTLINTM